MSDGKKYYCFCGSNCKYETMTKEQILNAIANATGGGVDFDAETPFVTSIKEINAGQALSFWVGTQAQYNGLATRNPNCLYIITDERTKDEMDKLLREIESYYAATREAAAKADEAFAAADFVHQLAKENKQEIDALKAGSVAFDSWVCEVSKSTEQAWHSCGRNVAAVFVSATNGNSGRIMTGIWTPATSGMKNMFYGYTTASLDSWDTTVYINGDQVSVTREGAATLTYYCTAIVV